MPRFVCSRIFHDFLKLIISEDEIFIPRKGTLILNGDDWLFICSFLCPRKCALAPFDQEPPFVFFQRVDMFQFKKHFLTLEPILQWKVIRFYILRIADTAVHFITSEEFCCRTFIADENAPVVISVAEIITLHARVLCDQSFFIALSKLLSGL